MEFVKHSSRYLETSQVAPADLSSPARQGIGQEQPALTSPCVSIRFLGGEKSGQGDADGFLLHRCTPQPSGITSPHNPTAFPGHRGSSFGSARSSSSIRALGQARDRPRTV